MAKKAKLNFIYLIGMALIAIGFLLPIFQFKLFGTHQVTGFNLVGDGDTALKIYTLLIFIGGVAGVVLSLIKLSNSKLLKILALLVSIIAFILVVITLSNSSGISVIKGLNLGKKAATTVLKSIYIGGYMIIVGWVLSAVGLVTNK